MKFLLHAIRDLDQGTIDVDEEIRRRILEAQRKAYQSYPYPCIRAFHHVSSLMPEHDAFAHIMKSGQSGGEDGAPLILDIGCCMGTDLRYVAFWGYPCTSMIGCDVRREFIDFGHELYSDRDTCHIPFFVGDVFDLELCPFPQQADAAAPLLKEVSSLNELRGRVKYIYAGALFHLFDAGTQEAIARRLATLLDVEKGSGRGVVFGRHSAQVKEGMIDDAMGRVRYAHSPESWERLWKCVVGDKRPVSVETVLHAHPGISTSRGTRMMWWSVWIG
ncbi:hypothetical protein BS17DRAFT_754878 [Gyrodon lividus]|nr:hypothetical protein BS17DRAFT_754878 [Gyrodon lividus]